MRLKTIYKCFLYTLVYNNPNNWFHNFQSKYRIIYEWVLKETKILSLQSYNFRINTRINWILNEIQDFPRCKQCGEYIEIWKNKDIPVTHKYPRYCKLHSHCIKEAVNNIKKTLANMPKNHWEKSLKKKRIKTCLDRYGYENVSQCPETIDKITNSISAHYGVKRYSQLECWYDETISSNMNRYGSEWYSKTDDYKQRCISTIQTKYNEEIINIFQLESIKEKNKIKIL